MHGAHVDPSKPVRVCDKCVGEISPKSNDASPTPTKQDSKFLRLGSLSVFGQRDGSGSKAKHRNTFFGILRGKMLVNQEIIRQ
jgi:hypothetical protein